MERMPPRRADAVTSSWAAGAGAGGGADDDGDLLINLGSGHPSGHGMLRLRLTLEGDRIVTADPVIGYVHRGAEKLFEARDYRQIIVLANRHDWLGAFASELGVVLAAERLKPRLGPGLRPTLRLRPRLRLRLGLRPRLGPRRPGPGNCFSRSWKRSPAAGCTTCSTGSAG
jgi:hypothetical protein